MNTKIEQIVIEQEKDIKNSYLIIKNIHIEKENYETKIFEELKLDSILKYVLSYEEGKHILKYDIKNKISLYDYLNENKLKKKDLIFVIKSIYNLLSSIENYLLSENSILLDTKSIMIEKIDNDVFLQFCFIPGMEADFSYELSKFLVRMLRHIDTTDSDALNLSYNLFIRSSKKNYSISDLMEEIEQSTLQEVDNLLLNYEKEINENTDEDYGNGFGLSGCNVLVNDEIDYENNEEKEEEKSYKNIDLTTFSKDKDSSSNDFELEIDDDTKKELNLSVFKKIGGVEEKNDKLEKRNNRKILLNANFKFSTAIWPILSILVPLLSYLILGASFFQKNYLIFAFYEIIIVLILSLNALVDNIFN